MAPSVSVSQKLSDLAEFIKAYKCMVYSCVTGPHKRCIESTVLERMASLRPKQFNSPHHAVAVLDPLHPHKAADKSPPERGAN